MNAESRLSSSKLERIVFAVLGVNCLVPGGSPRNHTTNISQKAPQYVSTLGVRL